MKILIHKFKFNLKKFALSIHFKTFSDDKKEIKPLSSRREGGEIPRPLKVRPLKKQFFYAHLRP